MRLYDQPVNAMPDTPKRLAFVTAIYWFLLAYVLAALVWWFIALEKQNAEITRLRLQQAGQAGANTSQKVIDALNYKQRKHAQYLGEGIIFMALIVIGASFVYRATRRYFKLGRQQQNFMMAVTHELKSPIAVARLNMETLQRRQLQPEVAARLVSQTLAETERLNDLCNNILLASRFDAGHMLHQSEPVDLSLLCRDTVKSYAARYPGFRFISNAADIAIVQGDPLLLKMLLNNLVENAVKYAPAQSQVLVDLLKTDNNIALQVTDEGPGIPEAERKKIFEKFYRLGNEATRNHKGTGLGLYLVKRIAEDHGAQVIVSARQPQGAIFTVVFPIESRKS
jgi:signal transduction histidine kinase